MQNEKSTRIRTGVAYKREERKEQKKRKNRNKTKGKHKKEQKENRGKKKKEKERTESIIESLPKIRSIKKTEAKAKEIAKKCQIEQRALKR